MSDKISVPSIRFRIVLDGSWVDPKLYLQDIDALLKHYLFARYPDWGDVGLEIRYDDIPWNSPDLVESTLNLLTWFEGVEGLINGENKVDIWAFEQSNCKMSKRGDILSISDLAWAEGTFCCEVNFHANDFMKEIYREGQVTLVFLKTLSDRILEISKQLNSKGIPSIIDVWIEESGKGNVYTTDDLRRWWKSICERFTEEEIVNKIQTSLDVIGVEISRSPRT